jgi:hypothetical protein
MIYFVCEKKVRCKMKRVKMLGAFRRIQATNGQIFSARFVKKDGTVRDMVCRLGVKKGVNGTGMAYNPFDRNLVPVFDMQKDAFRMINMETVMQLKLNGEVVYVGGAE